MARKRKGSSDVDLQVFALQIAKAVAKEVAEEVVRKLPAGQVYSREAARHRLEPYLDEVIDIDDSIIPMDIDMDVAESNVAEKFNEEKIVDSGLEKSKNKLASILRKKKES